MKRGGIKLSNKSKNRGLSDVITAVLLILIAIIAILLLWFFLKGQISVDPGTERISVDAQIKSVSIENNIAKVIILRNPGIGNISGFVFRFMNEEESYSENKNFTIKELETASFTINLTGKITNVRKVLIAPIIKTEKGKEYVGINIDEFNFTCIPSCAGKECGSDGCYGSCGSCSNGKICEVGRCEDNNPRLEIALNSGDIDVSRYAEFNYSINISCLEGYCGEVEVSLDPIQLSPENPTLTINVLSNPMPSSFVVENHYTDMVSMGSATFTGYAVGENIVIRYMGPISEYRFIWGGDCAGTATTLGTCNLVMNGDKTVSVSVVEACGDGVCDSGENINDCYKDCDVSIPLQACAGTLESTCYGYYSDSSGHYYNCNNIHECWGGNCFNCYIDYDSCRVNKNAKCFVVGDGVCGLGENSGNSEDCNYIAKNLVSTTVGATPFYTSVNPKIVTLSRNQNITITWIVNATGNSGRYLFFSYANISASKNINAISSNTFTRII